jgi:hypothetical protein
MTTNLERFKAIDVAYNARDWEAYSALLDETFAGWMMGGATSESKAEHVRAAQQFCAVSSDNQVHHSPYVVAFSHGEWTCTIARFTGTMTAPFPTAQGKVLEPTHRPFETSFATISRWVDGKIVEEHEFLDAKAILLQIGATG